MRTKRVTVSVSGIGCGGAGALTLERTLIHLPGIVRAYVNPLTEMAYAEFDPTRTTERDLVDAIEEVGFRAGKPAAV